MKHCKLTCKVLRPKVGCPSRCVLVIPASRAAGTAGEVAAAHAGWTQESPNLTPAAPGTKPGRHLRSNAGVMPWGCAQGGVILQVTQTKKRPAERAVSQRLLVAARSPPQEHVGPIREFTRAGPIISYIYIAKLALYACVRLSTTHSQKNDLRKPPQMPANRDSNSALCSS